MTTGQTQRASRVVAALAAAGGMILALVAGESTSSAQPKGPSKGYTEPEGKPTLVGAAVCQNCHEEEKPEAKALFKQTLGYEYVRLWENKVWAIHDLHARSYKNILTSRAKGDVKPNDTAERMENNLRKAYGDENYTVAADRNCLACHASTSKTFAEEPPAKWNDKSFVTFDGVGCEMCHGHGSLYETPHQRSTPPMVEDKAREAGAPPGAVRVVDWRLWTPAEKKTYGMIDLRDPAVAAATCASCHIGNKDEGRFVTHEMYAAGHPPLPPLDLMAFTREQPRHWGLPGEENMKYIPWLAEKNSQKAWEVFHYRAGESHVARQFAESSVATLRSSVALLGQLAQHAKNDKDHAGLDFAAFDCYSCHHDLKYPSDRQARGYTGYPGRPLFRPAPFALARLVVEHAAGLPDGTGLKGKAEELLGLEKELAASFGLKTFGDPERITDVVGKLDTWSNSSLAQLHKVNYTRDATGSLLARLVEKAQEPIADPEVAQLYARAFETLVLDLSGHPPLSKDDPPKPPALVGEMNDLLKGFVVTRLRPGAKYDYEQVPIGGVPANPLESVEKRLTDRMNTFNSFRSDLFRKAFETLEPKAKELIDRK